MYNGSHYLFRIYRPGAVVGDVELFTAGAATCSVQCIGRCRTVHLPMRPVRAAPESHSRLLFVMGSSVARKLVQNSHSEAVHATYPLLSRVASYYLYHDDPELRAGTLTELAQWLGASYRQLLRIHRQLADAGALAKRGSGYHVRSVELLERYAADALLEQPLEL
jgi:CRP-like cAMP-binding protein